MKNDKRMSPNKIYDVAGAAGVSLATVSRVLNHPEKVKPATRERIEKIIKELGYKPNLNAKGLASSRSTTVAVVVPELTRSSIAGMVDGIAATAVRRGYLLRLFVNDSSKAEDPVQQERELWRTVISSGVDGILYINDEIDNDYSAEITQAQLAGNFNGSLAVCFHNGLAQTYFADIFPRVHINADECFRLVDNKIRTALKPNFAGKRSVYIVFNTENVEKVRFSVPQFDPVRKCGIVVLRDFKQPIILSAIVNHKRSYIRLQQITNRA